MWKQNHCMRSGNFVGTSISDIPIGHLSWNFGKRTCHSLKYCNLWKWIFKKNFYQESITSFIEVGYFGCFDGSIICGIELENMHCRAESKLWCNTRIQRILNLDWILEEVQTSLHVFLKYDLIFKFEWKIKIFSNRHLKCNF